MHPSPVDIKGAVGEGDPPPLKKLKTESGAAVASSIAPCPLPGGEEKHHIQLSNDQKEAIEAVRSGGHVCITGIAGTGKSYVTEYIRQDIEQRLKAHVYRTGATGVAGANVKGRTIHSMSGMGRCEQSLEELKELLRGDLYKSKKEFEDPEGAAGCINELTESRGKFMGYSQHIVIDEAFYLGTAAFKIFIELLRFSRIITHQTFPQLILVGDPCQLRKPRPDKGYEDWPEHKKEYYQWDSVFMCDSDVWKELNIKIVCLSQNFRQSDALDVQRMQRMQIGQPSIQDLDYYYSRNSTLGEFKKEMEAERKKDPLFVPPQYVASRWDKVHEYNAEEFKKLPGETTILRSEAYYVQVDEKGRKWMSCIFQRGDFNLELSKSEVSLSMASLYSKLMGAGAAALGMAPATPAGTDTSWDVPYSSDLDKRIRSTVNSAFADMFIQPELPVKPGTVVMITTNLKDEVRSFPLGEAAGAGAGTSNGPIQGNGVGMVTRSASAGASAGALNSANGIGSTSVTLPGSDSKMTIKESEPIPLVKGTAAVIVDAKAGVLGEFPYKKHPYVPMTSDNVQLKLKPYQTPGLGRRPIKIKLRDPSVEHYLSPNTLCIALDDDQLPYKEIEMKSKQYLMLISYPIMHAWAVTVDRLQGCTVDRLAADVGSCWRPGEVYVVKSRVRQLKNLRMINYNPRRIKTTPRILKFYHDLKPDVYPLPKDLVEGTKMDDYTGEEYYISSVIEQYCNKREQSNSFTFAL